jgi:hypothetical protein
MKTPPHKPRARVNPFSMSERIKRAQSASLLAYTSPVTLPQAPWDDPEDSGLTDDGSAAYDANLGRRPRRT